MEYRIPDEGPDTPLFALIAAVIYYILRYRDASCSGEGGDDA